MKAIVPITSRPGARAGRGSVLALLLLASAAAPGLKADSGVVRFRQSYGSVMATVFTPAEIFAHGPTEVGVLLQASDSGAVLLDAAVSFRFAPTGRTAIPSSAEFCGPDAGSNPVPPAPGEASATLIHVESFSFPAAGDWTFQALVHWHGQEISVLAPLAVGPAPSRLSGLIPYLSLPWLIILLYFVNQRLRRPGVDGALASAP